MSGAVSMRHWPSSAAPAASSEAPGTLRNGGLARRAELSWLSLNCLDKPGWCIQAQARAALALTGCACRSFIRRLASPTLQGGALFSNKMLAVFKYRVSAAYLRLAE